MGAITVGGKGSRSRVKDLAQYRANFDAIAWPTRQLLAECGCKCSSKKCCEAIESAKK